MTTVTYIVWKKTRGLDLMLPVLWKIREGYPNAKITLLIAEINKHHLIRDGVFYIRSCEHHDIELLDFIDFLPKWLHPFKKVFRLFTKRVPVDGQSDNRVIDFVIRCLTKFLQIKVDYASALSVISADLLLINHQWWNLLPKPLMDLIIKHHKKIMLVQHGPIILAHEKPSDMQGRVMLRTNPYQYWFETPNGVGLYGHKIHGEHSLGFYESRQISVSDMGLKLEKSIELEQLTYVGFPGFDSHWFRYMENLTSNHSRFLQIIPPKNRSLRCMFLTRDIVDIEDKRREKYTNHEFICILKILREEIHNVYDVEILVKPHPKQNIVKLMGFLAEMGFRNAIVVADSLFAVLPSVDFAINMQSTGAYYALIYGLPCIHMVKAKYADHLELFNEMEYNVQRVVSDVAELPTACRALMQELHTSQRIANDVKHMRKFYPDGAIELIMEQLSPYLLEQSN